MCIKAQSKKERQTLFFIWIAKLVDFEAMAKVSGYDTILADPDQDTLIVSNHIDQLAENYGFSVASPVYNSNQQINGVVRMYHTQFRK